MTIPGPLAIAPFLAAASIALAASPSLTTLYSFTGVSGDGALPEGGLVIGAGGVLYGTTYAGGPTDAGTVFSLTPPAAPGGAWKEAVLYGFQGGGDASSPFGSLAIDSGGVLYGTSINGGANGGGAVFSLTPPHSPTGPWTETVLNSLGGSALNGYHSYAGVLIGPGGVLYGTTANGGYYGTGVVFSLTPPTSAGGAWTESVLCSLNGGTTAGLVMDAHGVLYGTTGIGSFYGGSVYSVVPPTAPGASWTLTYLYNFAPGGNGSGPYAGVVLGPNGVLYGTTEYGGTSRSGGTVFALRPPSSPGVAWTEAVLYSFSGIPHPTGSLVIGAGGVLYGTTDSGGTGYGTVFSLQPPATPGAPWTYRTLHSFSRVDGANPEAGVGLGRNGVLYGVTTNGGASGYGTVFSLKP